MAYRLGKLRILLIDDNLPIRMLIRSLLLDLGFGHIDIEDNIERGWASYTLNRPDIVMVDWRMHTQDGIEFTKRIRTDPQSPNPLVPIIIVTGYTNKSRVIEARDAGVTEFLIKPFTVKLLVDRLSYIIEKPRDFVLSPKFTGPDRRRRKEDIPEQDRKRQVDLQKNK